jgi:hypothetical protein
MDDGFVVRPCTVKFGQGPNDLSRECEPAARRPCRVSGSVLDARGCRINNGEEEHLPRVSGGILIGIQNPLRPGVELQTMQRIKLPLRLDLWTFIITSRQVVEMQDHAIPP